MASTDFWTTFVNTYGPASAEHTAFLGFLTTHGIAPAADAPTLEQAYAAFRDVFSAAKTHTGEAPVVTEEQRATLQGLQPAVPPPPVSDPATPVTTPEGAVPTGASQDSSLVPAHAPAPPPVPGETPAPAGTPAVQPPPPPAPTPAPVPAEEPTPHAEEPEGRRRRP
jgi:hypothetical protein